jgi:hypothetical protein
MGAYGGYKRFNAPHRLEAGWLTSANNVVVNPSPGAPLTLSSSSVVQSGSTAKALVQFGPVVSTSDSTSGQVYLASLRTTAASLPTSYDRFLAPQYTNQCVQGGGAVWGM